MAKIAAAAMDLDYDLRAGTTAAAAARSSTWSARLCNRRITKFFSDLVCRDLKF